MARVAAQAQCEKDTSDGEFPEWKLVFAQGWQRNLRVGGFFAGFETVEKLKRDLIKKNENGNAPVSDDSLHSSSDSREDDTSWRSPPGNGPWEDKRSRKGILAVYDGEEDSAGDCEGSKSKQFRARTDTLSRALVLESNPETNWNDKFSPLAYSGEGTTKALLPPPPACHSGAEDSEDNLVIEGEIDDYYLEREERLVSITNLPICIDGVVSGSSSPPEICLIGKTDGGGTRMIRVEMWKLQLRPDHRPRFLVKSTGGAWFRLVKPKAGYVKTISDGLTLAHFLHYVKRHPSASVVSAEQYLAKECSMHGQKPFLEKLSQHLKVIKSYMEEDPELKRASVLKKIFPNLLAKELPRNKNARDIESRHQILETVLGLKNRKRQHEIMESETRWDSKSEGESSPERHTERALVLVTDETQPVKKGPGRPRKISKLDHQEKSRFKGKAKKDTKRDVPKQNSKSSGQLSQREDAGDHKKQFKGAPKASTGRRIVLYQQRKPAEVDDPPICILCDDGGDLLFCEGPCHRHFHALRGAGSESFCKTLGMTREEVKKLGKYYCKNCQFKQHQCFICGKLGSSADTSRGAQEIFMCDVPSCKRYYHPKCVSEMLAPMRVKALADGIKNGSHKLLCPRHTCVTCGLKDLTPGKLVQCRRCPKAWHRECYTNYSLSGELRATPIWKQHGREFVYCRRHEILPQILTPKRNNVKFP